MRGYSKAHHQGFISGDRRVDCGRLERANYPDGGRLKETDEGCGSLFDRDA